MNEEDFDMKYGPSVPRPKIVCDDCKKESELYKIGDSVVGDDRGGWVRVCHDCWNARGFAGAQKKRLEYIKRKEGGNKLEIHHKMSTL